MATKVQPKKVLTKTIAPKSTPAPKTAEASKEAEKAERLKLIEGGVSGISEKITEYEDSRKNTENAFFAISDSVKEYCDENGLDEKEGRELIKRALADAGGFDSSELEGRDAMKKHAREYNYLSKIHRLAFPVSAKAAKELAKARDKGVTTEDALKIAREKATAASVKVSGGKGKTSTGAKATGAIEDEDKLKDAFAGVISKALKGGFSLEDIGDAFAAQLSEYEEQGEGDGDSE